MAADCIATTVANLTIAAPIKLNQQVGLPTKRIHVESFVSRPVECQPDLSSGSKRMRRNRSAKARARPKSNERPLSVRYAEVIKLRQTVFQASATKQCNRVGRLPAK
jgi:hypothetical protein